MTNNVQTCKLCDAEITDVEPVEIQGVIYPSVGICDDCDLNRVEAEKAARRIRDISEIRQSEFEEVCPKLFLLADPATLEL